MTLHGSCSREFAAVAAGAADVLMEPGTGFAVAVFHRGEPVVDLWAGEAEPGREWRTDTVVQCYSATKAVTALAAHWCVDQELLELDAPIAVVWPEFASVGKGGVTLRHVLAHRSGLHDVMSLLGDDITRLARWDDMARALERARPAFPPGSASAYAAVTYGYLVGEVVRRASGRPLASVIDGEIARPLLLDGCFVPLPDGARDRVAVLGPPPPVPSVRPPTDATRSRGPAVRSEFVGSLGNRAVAAMLRDPEFAGTPMPATHGFFTARSLARVYAMLAGGGDIDGTRVLTPSVIAAATTVQSDDPDRVMMLRMFWRLGFHRVFSKARAGRAAFGHNGFGGSGAWAEPARELAFAFVTNGLSAEMLLDDRMLALGDAAIRAVDGVG